MNRAPFLRKAPFGLLVSRCTFAAFLRSFNLRRCISPPGVFCSIRPSVALGLNEKDHISLRVRRVKKKMYVSYCDFNPAVQINFGGGICGRASP